jgi:hypothetical protein
MAFASTGRNRRSEQSQDQEFCKVMGPAGPARQRGGRSCRHQVGMIRVGVVLAIEDAVALSRPHDPHRSRTPKCGYESSFWKEHVGRRDRERAAGPIAEAPDGSRIARRSEGSRTPTERVASREERHRRRSDRLRGGAEGLRKGRGRHRARPKRHRKRTERVRTRANALRGAARRLSGATTRLGCGGKPSCPPAERFARARERLRSRAKTVCTRANCLETHANRLWRAAKVLSTLAKSVWTLANRFGQEAERTSAHASSKGLTCSFGSPRVGARPREGPTDA